VRISIASACVRRLYPQAVPPPPAPSQAATRHLGLSHPHLSYRPRSVSPGVIRRAPRCRRLPPAHLFATFRTAATPPPAVAAHGFFSRAQCHVALSPPAIRAMNRNKSRHIHMLRHARLFRPQLLLLFSRNAAGSPLAKIWTLRTNWRWSRNCYLIRTRFPFALSVGRLTRFACEKEPGGGNRVHWHHAVVRDGARLRLRARQAEAAG
jgi:hypothetical protein